MERSFLKNPMPAGQLSGEEQESLIRKGEWLQRHMRDLEERTRPYIPAQSFSDLVLDRVLGTA